MTSSSLSSVESLGYGLLAAGVVFIVLIIALLGYVIRSIGIMKLMQAKGMDALYRAWIPFWAPYTVGTIIEDEVTDSDMIKYNTTRWIVTFYSLCSLIPYIGGVLSLLGGIYFIVACAIMANKYNTALSMVISSIFGLSGIGYMILATKMNEAEVAPMDEKETAKTVEYTVQSDNGSSAQGESYAMTAEEAMKEEQNEKKTVEEDKTADEAPAETTSEAAADSKETEADK